MVPDAGDESSTANPVDGGRPADRPDAGFDEVALYRVVREAIVDALLDVIGTLLLVGIAFVFVLAGGSMALQGQTPATVALGAAAVLIGLYLAGSTLELVPPVREWFRG